MKSRLRTLKRKNVRRHRRSYSIQYYIYKKRYTSSNTRFNFRENYKFISVDIINCFEKISHKSILDKIPLSVKYLFLIKNWVKTPIIGPKSPDKNSKIITTIPVTGVPHGSIIGPLLCNMVLDGMEKFLMEPFFRFNKLYKLSKDDIRCIVRKTGSSPTKRVTNRYIKIYPVRFADDIFIFGKCSLEQLKVIQSRLNLFLSQIGLSFQDSGKFLGKTFNRGTQFDYLGFKFLYPQFSKKLIDQGKYSKLRYSPMQIGNQSISTYKRSGPFLLIKPHLLKRFFNKLKNELSPKYTSTSVASRIIKLNSIIRRFYNYFAITNTSRQQLKRVGYTLFTQFRKFLIRKYKSVRKTTTYIFKKHFSNELNTFYEDKNYLITPYKTFPYGGVAIHMLTPSMDYLKSNVFLDKHPKHIGNINRFQTNAKINFERPMNK